MNTLLDDESIIWLNEYTQAKIDKTPNNAWGLLTPHSYIAYVWPNYGNPIYYSEENRDYFNQLFKGYWGIDNDVSGWTLSEKGERMPLGWGNASYSRGYSVVYIALAQEAMNDQANLEKCQKIMIQAKVYAGDPAKQEEIYREALKVQPINIDAWYGLYIRT